MEINPLSCAAGAPGAREGPSVCCNPWHAPEGFSVVDVKLTLPKCTSVQEGDDYVWGGFINSCDLQAYL